VPDDVMIGLVRGRVGQPDAARGFVLDGFPRTVPQADALERMLAERGEALEAVLCMEVPGPLLVRRLTARRECPVCQRAYNLESAPPRDGRHCDDHPGTELVQRADDVEEIRRRSGLPRADGAAGGVLPFATPDGATADGAPERCTGGSGALASRLQVGAMVPEDRDE
jgi:adenylate kinase